WVPFVPLEVAVAGFPTCSLTGNGRDAILLDWNWWGTGWTMSDVALPDVDLPYMIPDGTLLRVEATSAERLARLIVAPGSTVLFGRGAGIEIGMTAPGALVADGSESEIVFASASPAPAPGDWNGLRFGLNTADGESRLVGCRIADGGQGDTGGGIVVENARPEIRDCRIEGNAGFGIALAGRDVEDPEVLRGRNAFFGNTGGDISWEPGPEGTVHGLDIVGREEVWTVSGSPHHVALPIVVRPSSFSNRRARLRIEPGCVVRFSPGTGLTARSTATIEAAGTPDSTIILAGEGDPALPGSWAGLRAEGQTSDLTLAYCRIEGAGAGGAAAVSSRGHLITGTAFGLRMRNCTVRGCAGPGVDLSDVTVRFHSNVVMENAGDALLIW
ncbi:MAG: hypothetical protein QUU85_10910, partial [Candidatus Eisenbacteria bacterium]|nr:hypothetical protein [Candidatus Eisenbacteria bacterium]